MENQPGAADDLRALGLRTVPVTVIGDRAIVGFRPQELSEALNLGVAVDRRDPSETLPLLDRLLVAVQRAVQQMPDEKLDFYAPDRERPMREFGYHIFRRISIVMEGMDTGTFPVEDVSAEQLRPYQSFKDIAKFGRQVIERYRAWAARQDLEALRHPPPPGFQLRYGADNGADLLDVNAQHTTHHLRQLYFALESFGIAPQGRLLDEELPAEYVLTILW